MGAYYFNLPNSRILSLCLELITMSLCMQTSCATIPVAAMSPEISTYGGRRTDTL